MACAVLAAQKLQNEAEIQLGDVPMRPHSRNGGPRAMD